MRPHFLNQMLSLSLPHEISLALTWEINNKKFDLGSGGLWATFSSFILFSQNIRTMTCSFKEQVSH